MQSCKWQSPLWWVLIGVGMFWEQYVDVSSLPGTYLNGKSTRVLIFFPKLLKRNRWRISTSGRWLMHPCIVPFFISLQSGQYLESTMRHENNHGGALASDKLFIFTHTRSQSPYLVPFTTFTYHSVSLWKSNDRQSVRGIFFWCFALCGKGSDKQEKDSKCLDPWKQRKAQNKGGGVKREGRGVELYSWM